MALFKRKTEEAPTDFPLPAANVSPDQILYMRQKGYSDDQIIQYLQDQGYAPAQISDAINQADMSGGAGIIPPPEIPAMATEQAFSQQTPPPPLGVTPEERERVEEIAEAIIDEKWNEFVKDINKVIEWKEKTESRIIRLEQGLNDLRASFDSLHRGMLGKISEYDKNLVDVGTEIKAMEKVFQKVLPTFTENVGKLSRMLEDKSASKKK